MQALTHIRPKVTIRDYVAEIAQEYGIPVSDILSMSDEVFPYYRKQVVYFIDYFYSLFGIEIVQLNNLVIQDYTDLCQPGGCTPGHAIRLLVFNGKTDQDWKKHPSKLPNYVKNMIARNFECFKIGSDYNDKIKSWYFLYWCYMTYQVSEHGREFFSFVHPFWTDLQETFLSYSAKLDPIEIKKEIAYPGAFPLAAEFCEEIAYEVGSWEKGDPYPYLDYAWFWDQEWVTDIYDESISDKDYFSHHEMTREQADFKLNFGWVPYDPSYIEIKGKVSTCTKCGNESGCTFYLSSFGDFYGENESIVHCGFCSHDIKVETESNWGYNEFGATTIEASCPAKMLAQYLDKGVTDDLVYKVIASKMLDEGVTKHFNEALELVHNKFTLQPSIVRAFAIKLLKQNTCIKRKFFYNCKHIPKDKAMYWSGILNMEMGNSIQSLGGGTFARLNTGGF